MLVSSFINQLGEEEGQLLFSLLLWHDVDINVNEVFLDNGLHGVHDAIHSVLVVLTLLSLLIVLPELTLELMFSDIRDKFIKQTANVVGLFLLVFDIDKELDHPALHDDTPEVRNVSADLQVLNFLKHRVPYINVSTKGLTGRFENKSFHLAVDFFRVSESLLFAVSDSINVEFLRSSRHLIIGIDFFNE